MYLRGDESSASDLETLLITARSGNRERRFGRCCAPRSYQAIGGNGRRVGRCGGVVGIIDLILKQDQAHSNKQPHSQADL